MQGIESVCEKQIETRFVCLYAHIRNCLHAVYVNMCLPEQVKFVRAGQCVCLYSGVCLRKKQLCVI